MQKMKITLDLDKITSQHKYNADRLTYTIDNILFSKCSLHKDIDGFYVGNGTLKDFSYFMLAITLLREQSWFVDNVSEWKWYNSDDSDNPNDFAVDDILEHYNIKNKN